MFGEEELVKMHRGRAETIGTIAIFCFSIVLARLWFLQIYSGKLLYQYSIENRLRKEIIKSPRGMVFSRKNQLIVHNVPRFDVVVTPQYLKNKTETLSKLSQIVGVPVDRIKKALRKARGQARYRPVIVKKNISQKELAIIETENSKMPGVSVQTFISREYNDEEIGAHLLGYISEISQAQLPKYRKRDNFDYKLGDFIGQAGLEEMLDLDIRGQDGHLFMEVDARGRMKRLIRSDNLFSQVENRPIEPGNNVRLTIDRDIQNTAYKALEGKVGSAVAVDIRTGEVLAMVSRPSFDPTRFSKGITPEYWTALNSDKNKPLLDRTIQEHYAPGSTFKTITAIAALEEGIVDEKTTVNCKGSFRFGRRTFHCWKKYGHGKVDLTKSIRESCDVYYYKIATKLDIDVLARYAKMFGFGNKTEIGLAREIPGLIPTKEWKKKRNGEEWQKGETLSCVIGQSYVLTTPLQLAMGYAAIANGGKLFRPHLVKEIFSNSGDVLEVQKEELVSEIKMSEKTIKLIRKGLYEVVNSRKGTAWWQRGSGIRMAGKTGTSQVVRFSADKIFSKCEDNDYDLRHHGIFVGYAPAYDPKIAVSAVVEHGCHGSSAAGPVAREMITTYMKKYYPELHKKYAKEDWKRYKKMIEAEKKAKEEKEAEAASSDT